MSRTRDAAIKKPGRTGASRADQKTRLHDIQNFRISLKQWRMLHAVIDCGGFSDAAEFLHLSQSAISYTIGKLQDQLGVTLLRVEGRKAQITEEGRALLQRSRNLLKAAVELETYAENLRNGWRAEVRLVVDHNFPSDVLMLALRKFSLVKPNIRVHLNEVAMPQAIELLHEHVADLMICTEVPQGFLGDPLAQMEYVPVANPGHALFSIDHPITQAELVRHVRIVLCNPANAIRHSDSMIAGFPHTWNVGSFDSAIGALQEGLGYAWLPRYRIQKLLDDRRLAILPVQERGAHQMNFYLVHGRPWASDPSARKLAEVLHGLALAMNGAE